MPAQRGIGWNWQVKGVPANPNGKMLRWQYVSWQMCWVLFYYAQSMAALTTLSLVYALRTQTGPDEYAKKAVADALMGWSGAVWVWDRLNCAFRLVAALGVARWEMH